MNGVSGPCACEGRCDQIRIVPDTYTSTVYVGDERVCSASVGPGTEATLAEVKRQADAWAALYEHALLRLQLPPSAPSLTYAEVAS